MIRRVIKSGNSFAVTIPQNIVKEGNIQTGDSINVTFEPVFAADKEIHDLTQKLIKEYRPALEELASK
ncbi:MAG: AbrB/MazE/SpoVT family DNA-binding domain-containing protein [Candidatus Woykebacteria bacterium]